MTWVIAKLEHVDVFTRLDMRWLHVHVYVLIVSRGLMSLLPPAHTAQHITKFLVLLLRIRAGFGRTG